MCSSLIIVYLFGSIHYLITVGLWKNHVQVQVGKEVCLGFRAQGFKKRACLDGTPTEQLVMLHWTDRVQESMKPEEIFKYVSHQVEKQMYLMTRPQGKYFAFVVLSQLPDVAMYYLYNLL